MPHLPELARFLSRNPDLKPRVSQLLRTSRDVRASEYHLTNACNIRCQGCWFFAKGMDGASRENKDLGTLERFLQRETRDRRVNTAVIIGGEPALFPKRLEMFSRYFRNLTISTNGLRKLPEPGLENATIAVTLFGAGPVDDRLRGIKPNGARFSGLFETALRHYRNDRRAGFALALTQDSLPYLDDTVQRIVDNGNHPIFNAYVNYDTPAARQGTGAALLDKALELKDRFPEQVLSSAYLITTILTGKTHWCDFGYEVCPSVSVDHPDNAARLANGHPYLPRFNTWAADLTSLKKCCVSGNCASCRDSQAISSMIVANPGQYCGSRREMSDWIDTAEGYWSQFTWTGYHPSRTTADAVAG